MKIRAITLIAATAALASCSTYDSRYGGESGRPYSTHGTSFSHLEGTPDGKPQRSGWFSSRQIREAESRSIARDIPYGVVKPNGTVVTD